MPNIIFNEADHTYELNGIKLDSVTTLIKSLCKPFDSETISQRMADRSGTTKEEILSEWKKKADDSLEKGTAVHSYIDDVFSGESDPVLNELNVKTPEMLAFDSLWDSLQTKFDAKLVSRESIVGCSELRIAGRYDALVDMNVFGSRVKCLFDWKTGRFRKSNPFQKLLAPFVDQDDCELVKYSIQLSMYRMLLEKTHPEDTYGMSYIAHLRSDGTHYLHRVIDYRGRISMWLNNRSNLKESA